MLTIDTQQPKGAASAYFSSYADELEKMADEFEGKQKIDGWENWTRTLFPETFNKPFAPHHAEFWEWADGIEAGVRPEPSEFASFLPRGGGKTTEAETAAVMLGAKETRKVILYVRATQDKANESIQAIADKIESSIVEEYYPSLAKRKVGKYGHSKGWSMQILRCENGFNVLGYGLDAAIRGVKIGDYRPDLVILDDIDDEKDSVVQIKKKVAKITGAILPALATHGAVVFMQNIIHAKSIASTIADRTADFLYKIHVSGPHPAVRGLTYEELPDGGYKVTAGEPIWEGQNLATVEDQINQWGISTFLRESQHEVEEKGGIWDHIDFRHIAYGDIPEMVRGEVWVDPAVTTTDDSDSMGISAGGLDAKGIIYLTYSWEQITTPLDAIKRAILKAVELRYRFVGIETNQGGDTWKSVYKQAWEAILEDETIQHIISKETAVSRGIINEADLKSYGGNVAFVLYDGSDEWESIKRPVMRAAKAGVGSGDKIHRNQRMLADYERGRIFHVTGTHDTAERALRRFPNKPLDYADAQYWLWYHLDRARRGSRIL